MGLFVTGSWRVICALGSASKNAPVEAMMNFVLGLTLKFPAAFFVVKIIKTTNPAERHGAIAAVSLVYFTTVVGMAIHGFRQSSKNR
jgi:uncharacterized Zn finger protein